MKEALSLFRHVVKGSREKGNRNNMGVSHLKQFITYIMQNIFDLVFSLV